MQIFHLFGFSIFYLRNHELPFHRIDFGFIPTLAEMFLS